MEKTLNINEDETIVFGESDTVSLYYAKDIPVNDEPGNFTVIDSQSHSELLEKHGKTYNDTLAIQVRMELTTEKPIFEGLRKQVQEKIGNLSAMKNDVGDEYWGAYVYDYEYPNQNLFSGKTITKIGVPVKRLVKKTVDGEHEGNVLPYLDLYVIDAHSDKPINNKEVIEERKAETFLAEHRNDPPLKINTDEELAEYQRELQEANDDGCGWIDFDCHIELGEDETLAFCGSAHGVEWLYFRADEATSSNVINDADFGKYRFIGQVGKTQYEGKKDATNYMFFDVYYEVSWSLAEQLEKLDQLEYEASEMDRLREKVSGKYVSILGDSISTYEGYSNEYETQNSKIKENGGPYTQEKDYSSGGWNQHNEYGNLVAYHGDNLGVKSVDETWWMRTIKQANMKLCVNNSFSGDAVTTEANVREDIDKMRCKQLHDNTTKNSEDLTISSNPANQDQNEDIYPDIVAFYMGINDFNYAQDLTPETFGAAYKKVVDTIFSTYQSQKPDLKVFVFTLLPNTWGQTKLSKVGEDGVTDEVYISNLEKLNEQIRQVAKNNPNVEVVDLYRSLNFTRESIKPYTGDELHPNAAGMRLISNCFIKALYNKFVGK